MIYGVHAQQSLKPVNARRLHKRAGPVVLPLVRGPPRPARRPSALRELYTTSRSGGDLAPHRFRGTFTPSSRRSPKRRRVDGVLMQALIHDVQDRQTSTPSSRRCSREAVASMASRRRAARPSPGLSFKLRRGSTMSIRTRPGVRELQAVATTPSINVEGPVNVYAARNSPTA